MCDIRECAKYSTEKKYLRARLDASRGWVFGMQPSVQRISEAAELPFAPSVSTVGALAQDLAVLCRAMRVLLRSQNVALPPVKNVYLLEDDAFALADPEIEQALSGLTQDEFLIGACQHFGGVQSIG